MSDETNMVTIRLDDALIAEVRDLTADIVSFANDRGAKEILEAADKSPEGARAALILLVAYIVAANGITNFMSEELVSASLEVADEVSSIIYDGFLEKRTKNTTPRSLLN
jgi:hypothetical protein